MEQKGLAEKSLDRQKRLFTGVNVYTEVMPLDTFYQAEDYHQKYSLKGNPLFLGELKRYYSTEQGITDSTAAARINGYLAGRGSIEELEAEIDSFGLSEDAAERLRKRVR